MSKKLIIGLAAAVVLASVFTGVYYFTDIFRDSKQFAVADAGLVTKITIEKDSASVVLEKKNGEWVVDGKGKVKPAMMQRLLFFLQNVEVKAPLPKVARKAAADALDKGFLITAEANGTVVAEFTVAEIPNMPLGTIGQLSGKSAMYLLHIPGTNFSVASMLTVDAALWLQNLLLSLNPDDIVSITVDNVAKPERSFKIFKGNEGAFKVYDSYNQHELENVNAEQLDFYLSFYASLGFKERVKMDPIDFNTLILSEPEAMVTIHQADGKTQLLKLYLMPVGDDYDAVGRPLKFDRDKLYVVYDDNNKVAIANWVDYDLLLKDVNFFLITN